ncbi:FAD-dependent monooxygenase [Micromonospora inyonensis]|uniref:FAD-dependent monooxygenase n=1 Tax=Micromonospora inyonensis TaxID=47866 RepID=UPI00114D224E
MTSRRHRTDVLVVGTGPVGLTLEAELARYGVDATVTGPEGRWHDLSCRVDAVRPYDDRVEARLVESRDGAVTVVTAGWLVACDGATAPLRPVPRPAGAGHPAPGTGRVFRCGGDRPGAGGHDGVSDAVNLGWKLAATLRRWAGAVLLDSYHEERRPAATDGPIGHRYHSSIAGRARVAGRVRRRRGAVRRPRLPRRGGRPPVPATVRPATAGRVRGLAGLAPAGRPGGPVGSGPGRDPTSRPRSGKRLSRTREEHCGTSPVHVRVGHGGPPGQDR